MSDSTSLFLRSIAHSATGREIAERDWSATPLGRIDGWPAALRATIATMLGCPSPMFLAWGADLHCFYNDAYRPILGWRIAEALGAPFRVVWASIWGEIEPLVIATLAGESRTMVDMPLDLARDGVSEESWWTFTYSPAHDDDGRIAGLLCITGETTGRILAERARDAANAHLAALNAALEETVRERTAERNLLATIFAETDSYVQVIGMDYRILALNRASSVEIERTFGRRPKVGDNLLDMLDDLPEDRERIAAIWGRALAGEEFTEVAEFGRPRDGQGRRIYELKFNVLRDEQGRQSGAFQVATDVTARVRAAAELERAQETIRQSQRLESIGQLTGGIAHDFNNLLTVIRGSVELLRRPDLAEAKRGRYLDAIGDTAERATRLTSQLLAFSRRQALKAETFEIGLALADLREIITTLAGSGITLAVSPPGEPIHVFADRAQLDTAIVNMVVNARDAMNGMGTLTLSAGPASSLPLALDQAGGDYVAVRIADTGPGIPADQLGRIFEPFYTTKKVGSGTGLGLSQAIGFAKQSGGDIGVASEVGQGTVFTLYLPRAAAEMPAGAAEAPPPPEPLVAGGGLHVLVVEDNAEVGEFATNALRELGYQSTLTPDAQVALDELARRADQFHIVFTDVVMPGMSGIELGEEVRRRYPRLPLILASGYSDVLARSGAHGFELLHKPYSIEQLSRVLHKAGAARAKEGTSGA